MRFGEAIIKQPWGVSTFGRGDTSAEPDEVTLKLAINRLSQKPDEALKASSSAANAVRKEARKLKVEQADITASRTRVHSSWSGYGPDRKFHGHQCRVEFSIRLRDLDLVDRGLVRLVDAGADEILDVIYDTQNKPALRAEARQAAVHAAQQKAALYAEAAGVVLGPVIHIEDVNPESLNDEAHRARGPSTGLSDLAPGQVTVSAAVVLGFSLSY